MAECGRSFECKGCDEVFRTRNALYKHARRKGHALPEASKPRERKRVTTPLPLPPPPPAPVIVKQVVRLARLVSTSTQTEHEDVEKRGIRETESNSTPYQACYAVNPLTPRDLSTQTEPCSGGLEQQFDLTDLATQTDFTGLFDFGTQTSFRHTTSSQTSQTPAAASTCHTETQSSQTPYLAPHSQEFGTPVDHCAPLYPDPIAEYGHSLTEMGVAEFGTQTHPLDLHTLVARTQLTPDDLLVEFGTQTHPPPNPTPSSGAMPPLDDLLVECWTQTHPPPNHASSGATPPLDDFLVEFGTQTHPPPNHAPSSGTMPPLDDFLVEFGTQTQLPPKPNPSSGATPPLDDLLVECWTQTHPPPKPNPSSGTTPPLDDFLVEFGTQTQPLPNHAPSSGTTPPLDDFLVEFGTQTTAHMLARDLSVEFGTQTSSSDDHFLLGMATQTEEQLLAHLHHGIESGTQTIHELFSDVGSLLSAGGCVEGVGQCPTSPDAASASEGPGAGAELVTPHSGGLKSSHQNIQ